MSNKKGKVIDIQEEKDKRKIILKNTALEFLDKTQAIDHISSSRDLPVEFLFELKLIKLQVLPLLQAYLQQKFELIERYGERNERKELVRLGQGRFRFLGQDAIRFQAEFQKLLKMESAIDGKRLELSISDIPKGVISEDDTEALEPLIDFIKVPKGEEE